MFVEVVFPDMGYDIFVVTKFHQEFPEMKLLLSFSFMFRCIKVFEKVI